MILPRKLAPSNFNCSLFFYFQYFSATITHRKDICRSVFRTAVDQNPEIFGNFNELCYDLQSTLFTKKLITENPDGITVEVRDDPVIKERLPGAWAQIKIKPVKDTRVLDCSELARISNNLEEVDHSLQQYLELETSQAALMNPEEHVTFPGGKSFLMHPERKFFNSCC